MNKIKPIVPERVRNIRSCTFGWIDHNFLHHGYLDSLSQEELLLYYFLITVADRNGVSFYDYERICRFLKFELDDFLGARHRLCKRSLIDYKNSIFQVLSLPDRQPTEPSIDHPKRCVSTGEFQALKDILNRLNS